MSTPPQSQRLLDVIKSSAEKIQRYRDRSIGEQNTKASLVEPILEALGWDIRDPDEVHREFRPTSKDCPVDYALKLFRKPRLFVEAKGLGEDLNDRKWLTQILVYTVTAGVEWCILTDGNVYRFYNAVAPLDVDEKLFCEIRLAGGRDAEAAKTLGLISRRNMEGNLLDVLWAAHFVDRRVKEALKGMIVSADKGLVRLIRRKTTKLAPKEIVESLRRMELHVESPKIAADAAPPAPGHASTRAATSKRRQKGRRDFGVKLADVVAAGLLSTPLKLFRKYKGKQMEATLLPDGRVEFDGVTYKTCSTAAEFARSMVTGRKMNTNGWSFWQYLDGNGKVKELTAARTEYLASRT